MVDGSAYVIFDAANATQPRPVRIASVWDASDRDWGDMLSDTALLVTGLAFVSILGGAWALHRRTLPKSAAPSPAMSAPAMSAPVMSAQTALQSAPFAAAPSPSTMAASVATAQTAAYADAGGAPQTAAKAAIAAGQTAAMPKPPPAGAATSRAQAKIETLVLRAALEDALEHLVEVYGEEYLDAFYERRLRRNVVPYRKQMASSEDPVVAQQGLRQAAEAEDALKRAVSAVRNTVKTAQG